MFSTSDIASRGMQRRTLTSELHTKNPGPGPSPLWYTSLKEPQTRTLCNGKQNLHRLSTSFTIKIPPAEVQASTLLWIGLYNLHHSYSSMKEAFQLILTSSIPHALPFPCICFHLVCSFKKLSSQGEPNYEAGFSKNR